MVYYRFSVKDVIHKTASKLEIRFTSAYVGGFSCTANPPSSSNSFTDEAQIMKFANASGKPSLMKMCKLLQHDKRREGATLAVFTKFTNASGTPPVGPMWKAILLGLLGCFGLGCKQDLGYGGQKKRKVSYFILKPHSKLDVIPN